MKTAAAYVRVSTDDQTEYSPEAQIRAIRSWASGRGYVIPEEYIFCDEGVSGRRAEKRPGFMRMIGMAKQKPAPFSAILVHKYDRFARSREDSVVYKSMLRKNCGVQVISIMESIEDDKFSVILEAMLEAMAEYYSINLSDEVTKGMSEKARRGERQSPAPFGYRNREGSLVPDSVEADIVRQVYQRFASGESYFSLAKWLNDSGIYTRRGNLQQNRTIRYMLTNQTYIGKNLWTPAHGRDSSAGYVVTHQTIASDAPHDPIIDMDLWDSVQRRVYALKQSFSPRSHPSAHADWPSGLVRCPGCGCVMVRNRQGVYADGRPKIYWICNGYAHGKCRRTNSCTDAKIKSVILLSLRRLCGDTDALITLIRAHSAARTSPSPYPAMLARLDQQLQRAKAAYQAGIDTLEEYAANKARITQAKAQIEAQQAEEALSSEQTCQNLAALTDTIRSAADLLESDASAEAKHSAAHELIEKVVFDKTANISHIFLNPFIIVSDH